MSFFSAVFLLRSHTRHSSQFVAITVDLLRFAGVADMGMPLVVTLVCLNL